LAKAGGLKGIMSSSVAQRIIFSTHNFSGTELSVLTSLAWNSDHDGVVSELSVRALALLSRISEKQASRVLKKLTCEGAITATPGAGRGHHTVYRLNMEIFNQSKLSVIHKGGVIKVFSEAALDACAEAAYKKRMADAQGEVSNAISKEKPPISDWAYLPVPRSVPRGTLRNTQQRRAARARQGDLKRHVQANIRLFDERYPPKFLEPLKGKQEPGADASGQPDALKGW
jgi:DNA-binding IscR family transcriptional regulator